MKTLITMLDERLTDRIQSDWAEDHWGEIPLDVFEREFKAAYKKITDHLTEIGLNKDTD